MRPIQILKLSILFAVTLCLNSNLWAESASLDKISQSHSSNTSETSQKIIVAVIDTGIDVDHRNLNKDIWRDPKTTTDEIYGWNFVTNKPNPRDENGHGTHIAGIIRSVIQPQTGSRFVGLSVPSKISIMPLKYYSEGSVGNINLEHSVKAIHYAIDHGAKIINYSGGGPGFSQEEFQALQRAQAHGILLVAAAGNEQQDTDMEENYYYPSAYRTHGLTNIITVAALNKENKLLTSSNWGKKNVDVAAPGEKVYSTLPNNRFGFMSGTSQATAFVTGVAAALLAQNPSLTPQKVRDIIISSVDRSPELVNKIRSGGKLNAEKAILSFYKDLPALTSSLVAQQPGLSAGTVKTP